MPLRYLTMFLLTAFIPRAQAEPVCDVKFEDSPYHFDVISPSISGKTEEIFRSGQGTKSAIFNGKNRKVNETCTVAFNKFFEHVNNDGCQVNWKDLLGRLKNAQIYSDKPTTNPDAGSIDNCVDQVLARANKLIDPTEERLNEEFTNFAECLNHGSTNKQCFIQSVRPGLIAQLCGSTSDQRVSAPAKPSK